MLEAAAALAAGASVAVAVLAAFAPRVPVDEIPGGPWLRRRWSRWWKGEAALAQLAVAIAGAVIASSATGLIPLALPGAIGSLALVRTVVGRRQAWNMARDRVAEPLFDMLAAAVLVQRPGGGELAPLFADLEATVAGAQEVEREADALQVQARSAAAIIVSLPVAFLLVLSALRSPYLDAFHQPAGEAFLLLMLAVMGVSYVWMRRLLRLDGLQRVRLVDA